MHRYSKHPVCSLKYDFDKRTLVTGHTYQKLVAPSLPQTMKTARDFLSELFIQ